MLRRKNPRSISAIAADIRREWRNPYFGAVPYLDAMLYLNSMNDRYGEDDAYSVIVHFLANASLFKGDKATELKNELRVMIGEKPVKPKAKKAVKNPSYGSKYAAELKRTQALLKKLGTATPSQRERLMAMAKNPHYGSAYSTEMAKTQEILKRLGHVTPAQRKKLQALAKPARKRVKSIIRNYRKFDF